VAQVPEASSLNASPSKSRIPELKVTLPLVPAVPVTSVAGSHWLEIVEGMVTALSHGRRPVRVPPEVTELGEIPVRDLPQPQVICDMTGLSGRCIRLIRDAARASGSMPVSYGS
jgi:hypothetical protein